MKKRFVKGISFVIAMIMLVAMIPMGAMTVSAATPIAYNSAKFGQLLWNVDFTSANFVTSTTDTMYQAGIKSGSTVAEATKLAVSYGETTTTNHRYSGYLKDYSLKNQSYTVDFDFEWTNMNRAKFFFAKGIESDLWRQSYTTMPVLGYEVKSDAAWGRIMAIGDERIRVNKGVNGADDHKTSYRITLSGGGAHNMTINYTGGKNTAGTAVGNYDKNGSTVTKSVIDVEYTIYEKNASGGYDYVYSGIYYATATEAYVHLGIGEWNALTSGQSYSMSNAKIYKGELHPFQETYNNANIGDTLFTLDLAGATDSAKALANGGCIYTNLKNVSVDENGKMTLNQATDTTAGFRVSMPFSNAWNVGQYTIEMELDSANRTAIHFLDIATQTRIGFGIKSNVDGYVADTVSGGREFAVNEGWSAQSSMTSNYSGVDFNVHKSYANAVNRALANGEPNIKVEVDGHRETITLYEKDVTTGEFIKIKSIDCSGSNLGNQLTFGVHCWNANTNVQLSNVKVVKGLTASVHTEDFKAIYDNTEYGAELYSVDFSAVADAAVNGANGYSWYQRWSGATGTATTLTVNTAAPNETADGTAQGVSSYLPLGNDWDMGYYTIQMAVNSKTRSAVHVFSVDYMQGVLERVGFGLGGNDDSYTAPEGKGYKKEGMDFSFGGTLAYKNTTDKIDYNLAKELGMVFATYAPATARKNTSDTGDANVKIEVNGTDKIATLYELDVNDAWVKISSIDFSAVADQTQAQFSVHVWEYDSDFNLSNVKYIKGTDLNPLVSFASGSFEGSASIGYTDNALDAFSESYAEKFALDKANIGGWTIDGTNKVNLEELQAGDQSGYAPTAIKVLPLMTYEQLTDAIAIRGVQSKIVGDKYNVKIVSAITETEGYTGFGYEITKVSSMPGDEIASVETMDDLVTKTVLDSVKVGDVNLSSSAVGGENIVAISIKDEQLIVGAQIDYIVKPFAYNKHGEKLYGEQKTLSFISGIYTPTATALEIPAVQ